MYEDFEDVDFDEAEIAFFKKTRSSLENMVQDEINEWSESIEDNEDMEEKRIVEEFWEKREIY